MATALQLITKAMQKCGVLVKSEPPSADEASDALDMLNDILASWSNDSIVCIARVTETFSLTTGVASYTIGSGQTFNTARPVKIIEAHVRQDIIDYPPMDIVDDEIYQGVSFKSVTAIPYMLNYTNNYPYGTINLYPSPVTGYTLYLTSEKELSSFTLSQTVNLPAGWQRALIYSLAIELAPEFGQPLDPVIIKIASQAKGAIAKPILRARSMDSQASGNIGRFNVYRGY